MSEHFHQETSSPKGNSRSPESNLPRSNVVFSKGSDQKQPRKGGDIIFPIIRQLGLSVAMETRFLIQSAPKAYAAFPPPMMLHIKFNQDWSFGFRDIQVQMCEIFVTQGQVTPNWVVWFGPKSNSSELLCLSKLSGLNRPKIKLVGAFMPVLVTSNFDDDSIKTERASTETPFSPL